MQIIHVSGYYPPHVGGTEYRTKELAEIFAKKGYFVQVIASDKDAAKNKLSSTRHLKINYLKSIEFAHTPLMFMLPIYLLKIQKESIIHLHIAHAGLAEITAIIAKIKNIPYVAHIHLDIDKSGTLGFLLPMYKKFFLRPVLQNANAISVLTRDYKLLIHKKYNIPLKKITVIPNGTYFHSNNAKPNILNSPVRLLFVGRLTVQKNIPLLLNAIKICVYKYKLPVHLTILGDGELKKDLLSFVSLLGLTSCVTFIGSKSPKEVQKEYLKANIFVFPSKSESFGSVIIEAMGSGLPVIATNILGIRNIIKSNYNGMLVAQNPVDLARAIQTVCKNSTLRKKIIKNGLISVKKYSWPEVAKKYEALYSSILLSNNK